MILHDKKSIMKLAWRVDTTSGLFHSLIVIMSRPGGDYDSSHHYEGNTVGFILLLNDYSTRGGFSIQKRSHFIHAILLGI